MRGSLPPAANLWKNVRIVDTAICHSAGRGGLFWEWLVQLVSWSLVATLADQEEFQFDIVPPGTSSKRRALSPNAHSKMLRLAIGKQVFFQTCKKLPGRMPGHAVIGIFIVFIVIIFYNYIFAILLHIFILAKAIPSRPFSRSSVVSALLFSES